MKRLVFVFLLCFTTHWLFAINQDSIQMRQIIMQMQAAWNRGDTAAFTKDYQYHPTDPREYRWVSAFGYYFKKVSKKNMGRLSFNAFAIYPCPDKEYCTVWVEWRLARKEGAINGILNASFNRFSKKWKLVSAEWTRDGNSPVPDFPGEEVDMGPPPETEVIDFPAN